MVSLDIFGSQLGQNWSFGMKEEFLKYFTSIFTYSLYSIMLQRLKSVLKAYLEMVACVILGLSLTKTADFAPKNIILEILLK